MNCTALAVVAAANLSALVHCLGILVPSDYLAQHKITPSLMRTAHLQWMYLLKPHRNDRADDISITRMTKSNHKMKQFTHTMHEMRFPLLTGWADPSAHGSQWEAGWGPRWPPCLHRALTLLQGQPGAP